MLRLPVLLALCQVALAAQQTRPNIVWLVAEDMSPWISCYGDDTVATPNLDRLAKESIRFTAAFATSPVCAPARSSLITGMYATRIGTMHMRTGSRSKAALALDPEAYAQIPMYEGLPPTFVRCFPEHLRAAGYRCTNNNKKDYQFREPVTVWDASSGKAHWRDGAADTPFFAVFNHGGTHESRAFPKARLQPRVVDPAKVPLPPFYPDTANAREAVARTYDNIAAMDAWVGNRLRELEQGGHLDDTVVFFYSDHGVGLPRGKRSPYDTGTRVPLLVRLPGGERGGTTSDRVVSFVDFGPTVLSLAGIEPDARLDGIPFLGPHARPGTGLAFTHADRFDSAYDRARSVSDGRFRYVRNLLTDVPYLIANAYRENLPVTAELYALRESGPKRPEQWQLAATDRLSEELYDSALDPWEVVNLIEDEQYSEELDELRAALDAWLENTNDLGLVLPESRMVREHIWPPDGVQPTTAEPQIQITDDLVTITCTTEGASIGYRTPGAGPWTVYTGPFKAPAVAALEIDTHRIGWKPARVNVPLR